MAKAETPVLMSPENPEGWKLEELLDRIAWEIMNLKQPKIENDRRIEAREVRANNLAICDLVGMAAIKQRNSMTLLASLGPNQGPTGTPRIGEGSDAGD